MNKKNIIIIILILAIILLFKNIKNKKELFTEIDGKICNKDSDCSSNFCLPSTDNKNRCLRKNIGECKKVNYPDNPGTCSNCKKGFKLTPVINGNWKCNFKNNQETALKNSLAISDKLFNNNELYLPIILKMNNIKINVDGKMISNNVKVRNTTIKGTTSIKKLGSKIKQKINFKKYDIISNNRKNSEIKFNINDYNYHILKNGELKLTKNTSNKNIVNSKDFNVHKNINFNDYIARNSKKYIQAGSKNKNLIYISRDNDSYFNCGNCKSNKQNISIKKYTEKDKFYLNKK